MLILQDQFLTEFWIYEVERLMEKGAYDLVPVVKFYSFCFQVAVTSCSLELLYMEDVWLFPEQLVELSYELVLVYFGCLGHRVHNQYKQSF